MRILYLDGSTGISGDMTAAALLDAGASRELLDRALDSLPVDGFDIRVSRVMKSGVDACDFAVLLDDAHENHDHDMEYLFGAEASGEAEHHHPAHEHTHEQEHHHDHEQGHTHGHEHHHEQGHTRGHEHHHDHEHTHEQEHHHHHEHSHGQEHSHNHTHEHRSLGDILHLLEHADMTEGARHIAIRTFEILAKAEAKAHNTTPEQVHFHEAGAVDSIVDITAAAVLLDSLQVDEVCIPFLSEGCGTVRCQHGVLPVPVPAVVHIVEDEGLPVRFTGFRGEYITPTGAAFAAAVRTLDRMPGEAHLIRSGTGAGKRAYEVPGLLRAMILETEDSKEEDFICRLEANIDDSTGEMLGYAMERLLEAGARDVFYSPVYMKKNRPGWMLNVICEKTKISQMEEIIFRETTTIGVRRIMMERTVLPREITTIQTEYGPAQFKKVTIGPETRYYPEYESAREMAQREGISLRSAVQAMEDACR